LSARFDRLYTTLRRPSPLRFSMQLPTVASVKVTMGQRLVVWLHALRRAFMVSG